MRRREFITLLGSTAIWPRTARAQQGDRIRRIGVLTGTSVDDPDNKARLAAFEQALQQLGWTVGRNVRIDYRFAGGAMPPPAANKRRNWSRSRRTSSCPLAAFRQDSYFGQPAPCRSFS